MSYTQYGMFGSGDVKYVLVQRGTCGRCGVGGEESERVGVVGVRRFVVASISVVVSSLLFFVTSVAYGVLVERALGGIGSDGKTFHLFEEFALSIAAVVFQSMLMGLAFRWEGELTGTQRMLGYVCTFVPLAYIRVFAWWSIGMAVSVGYLLVYCRFFRGKQRMATWRVFLAFAMISLSLWFHMWLSAVPVVLWTCDYVWSQYSGFPEPGIVDQRVQSSRRSGGVGRQVELSKLQSNAKRMVSVRFDSVPDALLRTLMYKDNIQRNTVDFRRWAKLGDAVLKMALVREGLDRGSSVADIACKEQKLTSRYALGSSIVRTSWAVGNLCEPTGAVSSQVCAEVVEALVGVSFAYAYCYGSDVSWYMDVTGYLNGLQGGK